MSNRNLKRNNSFSHSSFKERVTLDTTERQKKMQKLEEDLTKVPIIFHNKGKRNNIQT